MWTMYFNYKSYKSNFNNKSLKKKKACLYIKRMCNTATTPNCNSWKKKSMVMLTFSYFLKYIFITVYSMDCPITYTVHCVFFETVCPKANHSHSNNNISTWEKWCKMGSRSHSNLFDKKGWGWGTGACCMQRQQQKERFLGTRRSDSVSLHVHACVFVW